jgi:hypothetical protein
MIIHTRKYQHFDKGHIQAAKAGSKKVKNSTADRRKYLEQIRSKDTAKARNNLKRIPYNKISDFFGVAGVYFLMQDDALVYVGETSCVITRIMQHRQDKEFNGFRFLRVEDGAERLKLEAVYIRRYSPKYNITHNPSIRTSKPILRLREDLSQIDL